MTSHGEDEFKFGRSTPRSAGRSTTPGTDFLWWRWFQIWQIYPFICWQMYPPKKTTTIAMHHGIYIIGCIWKTFWILQEKVGISFYFWIIKVVNSEDCRVMSDVTPNQHPTTPSGQKNPETLPKHPPNDNNRFQVLELLFAKFNM